MSNEIVLSISILISNRKESLIKCLESLEPLLEKVPTELIAVDTGSEDGSIDIVKKYTDKITNFTWCQDFSAARNCGLKLATGKWFMFIDDDEWFEDVTELVNFFASGEYKKFGRAAYIQRSYMDLDGKEYVDAHVSRMSKLTKDLHFEYRVHEILEPSYEPIKFFRAFVHHYGYVYRNEDELEKHFIRNSEILLEELKENPNDIKNLMQLAQEYEAAKKYNEALDTCVRALNCFSKHEKYNYIFWIYAAVPRLFVKLGEFENACLQGERILRDFEVYELPAVTMYMWMIEAGIKLEEDEKVIGYIREFNKYLGRLENNPSLWDWQQTGNLTKDIILKNINNINLKGVAYSAKLNLTNDLENYLCLLSWNDKNTESMNKDILDGCKDQYPAIKTFIIKCLAMRDVQHPYIILQKALLAQDEQRTNDIKKYYNYFLNNFDLQEYFNVDWLLLAIECDLNIEPLLNVLDGEDWEKVARRLVSIKDIESTFIKKLSNQLKVIDKLKYHIFRAILFERKIIIDMDEENLYLDLKFYSEHIMDYCSMLYKEEVFQSELSILMLPKKLRFAYFYGQAYEARKSNNQKEYLHYMKKAVKLNPIMAEPIKRILKSQRKEMENINSSKIINLEFVQLGLKVKQEVRKLIDAQHLVEAKNVLNQLSKIIPDDKDVAELQYEISIRETFE